MSFTFVQFTDLHLGEGKADSLTAFREMVREINALQPQPEFVIHTGDICLQTGRGVPERYRELCWEFAMPVFDTLGNHDLLVGQPDSKALYRQLTGRANFYSFDHAGAHFVVLDGLREDPRFTDWRNVVGEIGGEEWQWLESDLQSVKRGTPIIAFSHIPIFSTFPQRHGKAQGQEPAWEVANRAEVHALLARYGGRLVLSGHFHENETIVRDGVTYVATGAVCGRWWTTDPARAPNIDGSPRGYRIVTVDAPHGWVHSLYKGIGQPITNQLEVLAPRAVVKSAWGCRRGRMEKGMLPVLVNVYDGHAGWRVEAALDDGGWQPMALMPTDSKTLPPELDGLVPGLNDSAPFSCAHLWRCLVPLPRSHSDKHLLRVRATDPMGRCYERQVECAEQEER